MLFLWELLFSVKCMLLFRNNSLIIRYMNRLVAKPAISNKKKIVGES